MRFATEIIPPINTEVKASVICFPLLVWFEKLTCRHKSCKTYISISAESFKEHQSNWI